MKRFLRSFFKYLLTLVMGFAMAIPVVNAQVTTMGVSPFSQYATQLEGAGLDISNIVINCDTTPTPLPAMGEFDATMATIGVQTGTILTSGSIGSGTPTGPGATSNNLPGDPDMNLIPQWSTFFTNTNDACAMTFDVVPSCDSIQFSFVFGSDEYPTFVGQFDDGFCAFIQGPGYPTFTNFAFVPGTTLPPSINNVNAGTNFASFVANGGGSGYNGRTVVITSKAAVTPCATYTIKMVVADEGDFTLDTGVFLEELSCGTDPPFVLARNYNNINSNEAVEECVDGYFTFFNPDTSQALTINYSVLGTATPGADYTPLPGMVTIPQGQDSINVPVNVVADGVAEGTETVIVALNVLSCTSDTAIMLILDPYEVDAGADQTTCSGEAVILGGIADPQVTYNWQSNIGFNGPANSANPTASLITTIQQSFNYVVTGTDENLCTDKDTTNVTYVPLPQAGFFLTSEVCVNDVVTITFTKPPIPGAIYTWDFGPNTGTVNGSGVGPYIVSWTTPGPKTVSLFVTDQGCTSDTVFQTIVVNPIPTATFTASSPVCAGSPSLLNYTGSAGIGATYMWDTDGGNPSTLSGQGPHTVTWNTPGVKEIKLVVDEKTCLSPEFSQFVTVFPVPTSDFIMADSVCEGTQTQIVYNGTGGPGASYAWNFDGGQVISGTGLGPYIVEWLTPGVKTVCLQVEENSCISSLTCHTINILATPSASIAPVANQCFNGNSFDFIYNGDPATSITWINGPDATPAISNTFANNNVSYLNPGIKTVYAVVTKSGCTSDTASISFEVVPEPSANFTVTSNSTCTDTCLTFTYAGTSLGSTQTYFWDFGTGAIPPSTTLQNPPCVDFINQGIQPVSLTVSYKGCTVTTTQQVNVSGSPIVSAGADVAFCEGDGGAQINASVSGGTAPYFYSWWCDDPGNCGLSSNAIEDPIANPNNPAAPHAVTYYFIVNDINGCQSNTDSVVVDILPKPLVDAGPDLFLCEEGLGDFLQGGLAPANAAPLPVTYTWTPATGLNDPNIPNPYARPTVTTIYTLVGTSANGCSSDVNTLDPLSTATVHVNPIPVAFAGDDTALCVGDQVQLQGFATGGGPNYNYFWTPATPGTISNPNSATPTISPAQTTTFTLVVESNGCFSAGDQIEVIVDTKPTANAGSDASICLNDSTMLEGGADGDPNATFYQYSWTPAIGLSNPNTAQPNASPSVTTTYTLTATSNFGCGSDQVDVVITVKPTPEVQALSPDTVICEGDQIELSATHSWTTAPSGPVVYTWSPENSIQGSPFLPNILVSPSQTTLYTIKASVASDDCPTFDQVLVTVSPQVEARIEADTAQFCAGDAVELTAMGGLGNANFTWTPALGLSDASVSNPMASPDTNTTYTVIVAEGACADTTEIKLTVNETPKADYFTSLPNGCSPLTVSFLENAEGAIAYEWDFGDGTGIFNGQNPTHTYDQPGDYLVTMTAIGPGGCTDVVATTTINVSDNVTADFQTDIAVDSEVALPNAAITFTDLSVNASGWYWDFGDGNVSTDQNPVHTYDAAGDYTVSLTVTDERGCVQTIEYGPYHVVIPDVLIPNVFSPNNDGINDVFIVRYNGTETFRLKVFDRWGRAFFEADAADKAWEGTTEGGAPAQEGVYFYSIQIGENSFQGNVTLMR